MRPLADGQAGALGTGVRLQPPDDVAAAPDPAFVAVALVVALETDVLPARTATPTDGFITCEAVPDLRKQMPSVFAAPSKGSAPVYVYEKPVQPVVESQVVMQDSMLSERGVDI